MVQQTSAGPRKIGGGSSAFGRHAVDAGARLSRHHSGLTFSGTPSRATVLALGDRKLSSSDSWEGGVPHLPAESRGHASERGEETSPSTSADEEEDEGASTGARQGPKRRTGVAKEVRCVGRLLPLLCDLHNYRSRAACFRRGNTEREKKGNEFLGNLSGVPWRLQPCSLDPRPRTWARVVSSSGFEDSRLVTRRLALLF